MAGLKPADSSPKKYGNSERALSERVALVTGAGRRIGRAVALELARAGAHVVVHYNTSQTGALVAAREIRQMGLKALVARADISRPHQVRRMFDRIVKAFDRLDILVNNAAVFYPTSWDKISERDWEHTLGVNLQGPFFCAQAAARIMLERAGGEIINIASLGGLQAWPSYMPYCSSKAAVIMLTRCLAKALAPKIRVNAIAPGTIAFPGEERQPRFQRIARATPLQSLGRAEDIADLAVFLATCNRYITGQVFAVDGGKSVR
jgi:NAD(P)-dependent dehydrogenase (short-subunit alcohol dehydrogenase family)